MRHAKFQAAPSRMDWSPDVQCFSSPSTGETGAYNLHKVTLDSYSIAKFETRFVDMEWMRWINKLPVAEDDSRDRTHVSRDSVQYKYLLEDRQRLPLQQSIGKKLKIIANG